MSANSTTANSTYRWLGLSGVIIVIANNWLSLPYLDLIARVLWLAFAFMYWRQRKDGFSVLLLVCAAIIFILDAATILEVFITPTSI